VDAPVPDARKGHLIGISSLFWKTAGLNANLYPAAGIWETIILRGMVLHSIGQFRGERANEGS